MAVFEDAGALAMHQRARFQAVIGDQMKLHGEIALAGKEDFFDLTRGGIKTKTLRAMGHPFARRGSIIPGGQRGLSQSARKSGKFLSAGIKGQVSAKGIVGRLPINIQSGQLRRGIQLVYRGGSLKVFELFSTARHAKYVLAVKGTDKMVERGLLGPTGELRKRHQARIQTVIDIVRKTQKKR